MKLIKIPEDRYYEYKIQAMFDCYKWDPQFCDSNTLSKHILILTQKENEAGLTKAETQEAIERLDALIRSIEKAQQTVNDDQTMNF